MPGRNEGIMTYFQAWEFQQFMLALTHKGRNGQSDLASDNSFYVAVREFHS